MLERIRDFISGFEKQLAAWLGGMLAWISLDNLSKSVLLIYTGFLLFFLLRDKWWRQRGKDSLSSTSE